MATPARTGALAAVAGFTRVAAWAPDWRGAFSPALTREIEERRFFLWKKYWHPRRSRISSRRTAKFQLKPSHYDDIICSKMLEAA
jgi:hypothetical protein